MSEQAAETDHPTDHPDVVIFPPILLMAVVALGVILDWFVPLGFMTRLPGIPRILAGAALILFGLSMPLSVRKTFTDAGTNIRPDLPTKALVTTGLFAHARNPVYLGGTLALIGVGLLLASDWIFILLIPALLVIHFGVVKREERYLEQKFGAAYLAYKASVPRYGWKF